MQYCQFYWAIKSEWTRYIQGHKMEDESAYLQDIRNYVFLTLFEKTVFVKGGICLHDLCQHLRHLCLWEKTTYK